MTDPSTGTDLLNQLALPETETLDSVLAEKQREDQLIDDDPERAEQGFGKTRLEARAEIPSLARLQHRRRMLVREIAPLAALFEGGQNPPAEAKRKQHRNLIATLIAQEQGLEGDKMEAKLERLANADPRHLAFCAELDELRVKYKLAINAVVEVNEEIADRAASHRSYNEEVRAGLADHGEEQRG